MGAFLSGARRRGSRQAKAVLGVGAVAAACAAFPATVLADFTASLSLDQSAGTTAGSSPAIGFDEKFGSTTGDGAKTVTLALPPGLLGNESIAGGGCLLSSSPNPACQVGSGTLTLAGGGSQSLAVDLVKPLAPADFAGLAFVSRDHAAGHLGRDARSQRRRHRRLESGWGHRRDQLQLHRPVADQLPEPGG